eukprot:13899421-Ditylum_brightwellii.AAC.1
MHCNVDAVGEVSSGAENQEAGSEKGNENGNGDDVDIANNDVDTAIDDAHDDMDTSNNVANDSDAFDAANDDAHDNVEEIIDHGTFDSPIEGVHTVIPFDQHWWDDFGLVCWTLDKNGEYIIDVPPDGDCGYHTIIKGLNNLHTNILDSSRHCPLDITLFRRSLMEWCETNIERLMSPTYITDGVSGKKMSYLKKPDGMSNEEKLQHIVSSIFREGFDFNNTFTPRNLWMESAQHLPLIAAKYQTSI